MLNKSFNNAANQVCERHSLDPPTQPLTYSFSHALWKGDYSASVSAIDGLKQLYKEGGLRTLFAGVQPRVMWIGIGGFIFFGAFEKSKTLLHQV